MQSIAQRVMLERGLLPTFSDAASAELQSIQAPQSPTTRQMQMLRRFAI